MRRSGQAGGPRRRRDAAGATQRLRLIVAVVIVAAAQAGARAETSVVTEAGMAVEYNDNIRLTASEPLDTLGRFLSLGARFAMESPEQEIHVRPSLRSQRYRNAPSLDDDDYFLDVDAERKYERSSLGLQGNYYRDTPTVNDLDSTGLVEVGVRRERAGIHPEWSLELGPASSLSLAAGYDTVDYARDTRFGTTVDYDFSSASVRYGRQLEEESELSAALYAQRLDAPDISNQADHQGVQASYSFMRGEGLSLSATAGYQRSRFINGASGAIEDSGMLFSFNLERQGEYHVASLGLARAIEPSGTGTLMRTDNLTLSARIEIDPELSSSVALSWSDRTDLQGLDPGSDRTVEQAQLGLRRGLYEHWVVSAGYRYTRQRLRLDEVSADSSAVMISISYAGDRRMLTR